MVVCREWYRRCHIREGQSFGETTLDIPEMYRGLVSDMRSYLVSCSLNVRLPFLVALRTSIGLSGLSTILSIILTHFLLTGAQRMVK